MELTEGAMSDKPIEQIRRDLVALTKPCPGIKTAADHGAPGIVWRCCNGTSKVPLIEASVHGGLKDLLTGLEFWERDKYHRQYYVHTAAFTVACLEWMRQCGGLHLVYLYQVDRHGESMTEVYAENKLLARHKDFHEVVVRATWLVARERCN